MSRREGGHLPAVRAALEKSLGITERCTPTNITWTGDIRKRYTDFLVYEVLKDGSVIHLYDIVEPNLTSSVPSARFSDRVLPAPPHISRPQKDIPAAKSISDDDMKTLQELIGTARATKLVQLDQNIQANIQAPLNERAVTFDPISDRDQRTTVHKEIRRIFEDRIETTTDRVGVITATPTKVTKHNRQGNRQFNQGRGPRRDGDRTPRMSFNRLGGEYLHFTLYKENKDTMEAINMIARKLKVTAGEFNFYGTKDRRAATTQRISVRYQREHNLTPLNALFPTVKMGDFMHLKDPIQLGQHGGNEFIITLKNCEPLIPDLAALPISQRMEIIRSSVEGALSSLKQRGFLNYFGLQRFGTFTIGTHLLGMKILRNDFEGAINDILYVDEQYVQFIQDNITPRSEGSLTDDDFARARAIHNWKMTGNSQTTLEILPKRFSTETAIIQHLGHNPRDFMGAVLSITRGMRTMYIHAYQSYVWNFVASHRWAKYGSAVIVGDLVLTNNDKPDGLDLTNSAWESSGGDSFYAQAHVLTKEDVANGKYTIFDIVLPTPGYDVIYPRNDIGDCYVTFMGKEENGGLNPYDMRRMKKEFSLSGSYRPLIGRFITEPEYAIRLYNDDTEQLYPTDLDIRNWNQQQLQMGGCGQASTQTPRAADAPMAPAPSASAHWANFTNNPSQYDQAMDENRRRKATEAPPSDGVVATRSIWVKTGLDDGAKRVKLARQDDTVVAAASSTSVGGEAVVAAKAAKAAEVGAAGLATGPDPYDWYGEALPDAGKGVAGAGELVPLVTKVGGITLPTFCKPSDDPLSSKNNLSHELINHPGAQKVAVVLKFQLGTSNYATVILRELMGSSAADAGL